MSYLKRKTTHMAIGVAVLAVGLFCPQPTQAFTLRSVNFFVKFGQVGVSQAALPVVPAPDPAVAGDFTENGHAIFSGYSYNSSLPRLTSQMSDQELSLGSLSQGTKTVSQVLEMTTNAGGYVIETSNDHLLRQPSPSSATPISATTCDTKCDPGKAGPWSSANRPGFGYSILGENRIKDFETAAFFRPLADRENGQFGQRIVQVNQAIRDDVSTVVYKVVSNTSLANGTYQTGIKISFLPAY